MDVWQNKEETDIMDCIIEAWQNNGAKQITNFHKYDRAHEEGVDLSCTDSAGLTINLQTKIKPRQKDIDQLQLFSKSESKKKIYVYVVQPSKAFLNSMEKLTDIVEFWDKEKLHVFLIEGRSQKYIEYLFWNSELLQDLENIVTTIFKSSKVKPLPLDSTTLEQWWELKDRTVKLHADVELLEYIWRDKLLSQDMHNPIVLKETLNSILLSYSIISKTCSKDILSLIKNLLDHQPNVLSKYVASVLPSSPWMGMYAFKEKIDQSKERSLLLHRWILPQQNYNSEYSMIANILTELRHCSEAIEDGVDFVFRDYMYNNLSKRIIK